MISNADYGGPKWYTDVIIQKNKKNLKKVLSFQNVLRYIEYKAQDTKAGSFGQRWMATYQDYIIMKETHGSVNDKSRRKILW